MTTDENTSQVPVDVSYDRLPPTTQDGIYTLIMEHPSTSDTPSQPPPFPPNNHRHPQRDTLGYSSVHKPKKNDQPNRSKTFSGRKTPPTVHTTNDHRAQSSAPSPSSNLTKGEVFNENYSDVNITLKELVDKYYERFPVLIRVTQGVCGRDERVTLSSLDCFKVHFLKHVDIISITCSGGISYNVPQSSVLEFGLIYKPDSGVSNGEAGVQFNRVADILASQPRPKLLCVEESWSSPDGKVSLAASEVLVVVKTKKKLLRKSSLVVYSFSSHAEKVIPEDCAARFSTKPHSVRLHLPDIVEHIHDPFPCDAYIFVEESRPECEFPDILLSTAVRINGQGKESTLVAAPATPGSHTATAQEVSSFVEIPLDLKDVTLSVIAAPSSVVETEQLYDDTRRVLEKFNPSMFQPPPQESESSNTQQVLYSALRGGYETVGMSIDVPSAIRNGPPCAVQASQSCRTPSPPPPPPTPPPVPSRATGLASESLLTPTAKPGESFHYPGTKDTMSSKGSAASSLNGSPMKPLQRPLASEDTSPSSASMLTFNPRPPMPLPGSVRVEEERNGFSGQMADTSDKEDGAVVDGLTKSSSEASWHGEYMCAKVNEVQLACKPLDSRMHTIESTRANSSELMKLRLDVESLSLRLEAMSLRLEAIEKLLTQNAGGVTNQNAGGVTNQNGFRTPTPPSPPSPSSVSQNIEFLKSLDCSKVSLVIHDRFIVCRYHSAYSTVHHAWVLHAQ